MAVATAAPESPPNEMPVPQEREKGTPPSLPVGFRRLSDTRKRSSQDAYAALRAVVGTTIQLDGVGVTRDDAGKLTGGTMTFSPFMPEGRAEGAEYPSWQSPIPKGAIRAIVAAITANPDDTIVADVVQTKRGVALR